MNEMFAAVAGRRPRTLVPLLATVFIIAWGLLTMLVVLQDRMIDAQAELIHTFFNQSVSRARPVHVSNRMAASSPAKQAHVMPKSHSVVVAPVPAERSSSSVSQIPLSERASAQSPSSQVKPRTADKSSRSVRKGRSPFSPPPAEITDPSDQRRVLNSI